MLLDVHETFTQTFACWENACVSASNGLVSQSRNRHCFLLCRRKPKKRRRSQSRDSSSRSTPRRDSREKAPLDANSRNAKHDEASNSPNNAQQKPSNNAQQKSSNNAQQKSSPSTSSSASSSSASSSSKHVPSLERNSPRDRSTKKRRVSSSTDSNARNDDSRRSDRHAQPRDSHTRVSRSSHSKSPQATKPSRRPRADHPKLEMVASRGDLKRRRVSASEGRSKESPRVAPNTKPKSRSEQRSPVRGPSKSPRTKVARSLKLSKPSLQPNHTKQTTLTQMPYYYSSSPADDAQKLDGASSKSSSISSKKRKSPDSVSSSGTTSISSKKPRSRRTHDPRVCPSSSIAGDTRDFMCTPPMADQSASSSKARPRPSDAPPMSHIIRDSRDRRGDSCRAEPCVEDGHVEPVILDVSSSYPIVGDIEPQPSIAYVCIAVFLLCS